MAVTTGSVLGTLAKSLAPTPVDLTQLSGLNLSDTTDATLEYKTALDRIKKALDARENKAYDPHLLAVAQGLLTPGKTGSFFEGVAQAAGNVREVQGQLQKEEIDNAQMRLQLAKAEREQDQMERAQRAALGYTGVGAPAPAGAKSPAGAPSSGGGFKPVSLEFATDFQIRFPNSPLAKSMMDAAKAGIDRFKFGPGGSIFDSSANGGRGDYVDIDIPGQKQEKFETPYGTFPMTPNEYSRLNKAMSKDLGKEWIDAFRKGSTSKIDAIVTGGGAPPAVSEKKDGTPSASIEVGRKTTSEIEAESAAKTKFAEKTAESEAERTQKAINAASDADSRLNSVTVINSLMKQEGMSQVTGVLEKPGFLPAILLAAEEGISAGRGFGLSLKQVRDVYTNNKISLPPVKGETPDQYRAREEAVISRLQQLSSEFARITFSFRSMAQGQGAISNLENNIFQSMGPTVKDTYQTIMAKTAHSAARAEADKKIAESLTDTGMTIDRFKKTEDYKKIQNDLDNQLRVIYGGVQANGRPVIASSTTTTTKPAGKISAEDLRKELNK